MGQELSLAAVIYAVTMAALSTLGNAWGRRESRIENEAKIANDAEKLTLKSEVDHCTQDRAKLMAQVDQLGKELDELRQRLDRYLMSPPTTTAPVTIVAPPQATVAQPSVVSDTPKQ